MIKFTKMKILLIGNMSNKDGSPITDGGSIKVELYRNLLIEEGFKVTSIDTQGWKRRPFKYFFNIFKQFKKNNLVLLMAGPNGSRMLIPIISFFKNFFKYKAIFIPLGTGVFDSIFNRFNNPAETAIRVIVNEDYRYIKDNRIKRSLKKFDYIFPENDLLTNTYKKFYKLDNVRTIRNFRKIENLTLSSYNINELPLKLVFLARISNNKGIFDLMESINEINKEHGPIFSLDIFGEKQLLKDEEEKFNNLLSTQIHYKGRINQNESVDTLKRYFFSILPTKYHGEGTPGSVIESFLAGTPIIISSYSQHKAIMTNDKIGYVFEINNKESLKKTLLKAYDNRTNHMEMQKAAFEEGKKYTYAYNRDKLLGYFR